MSNVLRLLVQLVAYIYPPRDKKEHMFFMKIKYQFANESIEIEVSDDWGNILIGLDRLEYNVNQKETRRHVSLNGMDYEYEIFLLM